MNISDHLTPIINKYFKDSDAGKAYMCRRTKTAAIVNCIGDDVFENVKSSMQQGPFSLLLDVNNDTGIQKMIPITVRLYDVQFNRIMTHFFDMNVFEVRDSKSCSTVLVRNYQRLVGTTVLLWASTILMQTSVRIIR